MNSLFVPSGMTVNAAGETFLVSSPVDSVAVIRYDLLLGMIFDSVSVRFTLIASCTKSG